jgi:hypothetical protein
MKIVIKKSALLLHITPIVTLDDLLHDLNRT